jgi:anti-sigma B factor antagonist
VNTLERDASAPDDQVLESEPPEEQLGIAVVAGAGAGDWAIVAVNGEVDLATAPALHEALTSACDAHARVILDLSAVSFMDSTGLSVLIRAYKRSRDDGRELRMVVPGERILRLLQATKLDELFTTFTTVASAQAD